MTTFKIVATAAVLMLATACAGVTVEPLPRSEIPEIATPNI